MLAAVAAHGQSQRFFNLTVDDIEIDSVLPEFTYSIPLGKNYADSTYSLEIRYPEFIEMNSHDIELYNKVSGAPLPALPQITKRIVVDRKNGSMEFALTPIVERNGKKEFLVSFMIAITAKAKKSASKTRRLPSSVSTGAKASSANGSVSAASRYAAHSKLGRDDG